MDILDCSAHSGSLIIWGEYNRLLFGKVQVSIKKIISSKLDTGVIVKCLLYKHEYPSLIPRTREKARINAVGLNSSTGEALGWPLVSLASLVSLRCLRDPVSKNKVSGS